MTRRPENTPLFYVEHLTQQQVFDVVVAHAATMTERCAAGPTLNDVCLYRGAGGKACFIGCLLTDDEARGLDDNRCGTVRTLARKGLLPGRLMRRGIIDLLEDLQIIHDGSVIVGMWPWMFMNTASDFGLNTRAIEAYFPNCSPETQVLNFAC